MVPNRRPGRRSRLTPSTLHPQTTLAFLAITAVALAGCLGAGPAPPAAGGNGTGPAAASPTQGVVHVPGDGGPVLAAASALGEGVPVPVGMARPTGVQAFEPTIGTTSDGTIFMTNREHRLPTSPLLYRSPDDGRTWTDVTPKLPVQNVSFPPDTNDVYVHVDPDTDRVFEVDLQSLTCSTLSFSDDLGESWTMNPLGCGHPVGVHDHQTVFTAEPRTVPTTGYDNVVYYCINRLVDSACATSLNGGLTFGPLRPLVYAGAGPEGFCGGLHAHGTSGPDGTVYLPRGYCGTPSVAISSDDGLTWDVVAISEDVAAPGHEVAFAVDTAGNAYAFWISDDRLPYLATSDDGGATWADPVMVAPPGVATTDFPTIAAGDEGRIAMAYYGTSADKAYSEMDETDTWNAYITVAVDSLADEPAFATVTANDPADPVARGVCGGSRCYGDNGGGPGDFIDVTVGPDGRPWAAFVDSCTQDCAEPDGTENDVAIGFAGTLAQGPALRGNLTALPPLDEGS